jgi:hypothetical protein
VCVCVCVCVRSLSFLAAVALTLLSGMRCCSCDWNLEKQLVFYDSLDITTPHMAFFAASDIEPFTELTFNYGYKPGSINGRRMECHCGSDKCQGFLL